MLNTARIMMNSSRERVGGTLSLRLRTLSLSYTNQKHIWDIGCDHGLLGSSFLQREGVETVSLVDASPLVIEALRTQYKDSYISKAALNIVCAQGQNLNIPHSANCIFIAGMGGKEIFQIISNLLKMLDETSVIVISPHRWNRELRRELRELPLSLKKEEVIFEHDRFYEIMTLIPGRVEKRVSLFGEEMWKGEVGQMYKAHQLEALKHHKDEASLKYLDYLKML